MTAVVSEALMEATLRIARDLTTGTGRLDAVPVIGLKEMGRMFRVGWNTPYQWRTRGLLPPPDDRISGNPVWRLPTIYEWARITDRTIVWDPWGVMAPADDGEPDAVEALELPRAPSDVPQATFAEGGLPHS